jgi:hypothetical protein
MIHLTTEHMFYIIETPVAIMHCTERSLRPVTLLPLVHPTSGRDAVSDSGVHRGRNLTMYTTSQDVIPGGLGVVPSLVPS